MAGIVILAVAAQTVVQAAAPPSLPQSLHIGSLAVCAPTSLERAEDCLKRALSAQDLAIVQDRISARQFRPSLDCEIEEEWRLTNPSSAMAKVMQAKLGFQHPDMAAGMIISDFQARSSGSELPFDQKMRDQLRAVAAGVPSNECARLKANVAAQERANAH